MAALLRFHALLIISFKYGTRETGGVERIPPGYDRWIGLVGNSRYYNYTLSVDGQAVHHGDDYHKDYLTDILVNIYRSSLYRII